MGIGEKQTACGMEHRREVDLSLRLSGYINCEPYEVTHTTGERTLRDRRALYGVGVISLKEALPGYDVDPDWAIVGDQAISLFEGRIDDNINHINIRNEKEVREYFAKHSGMATVLWHGVTMYINSEAFEELMAKYGIQGEDV